MASFPPVDLWEWQEQDVTKFEDVEAVLWAWDMGTGKTRSAIERDRRIRLANDPKAPTLVVAPLATHGAWVQNFHEHTPLTAVSVDTKARHKLLQTKAHVYIVHWEALRLMPSLQQVKWQHVIADEAHKAKNRKSAMARNLKRIKPIPAPWKTALTGSPVTSKPHDFWSVLNWLYPMKYTSFWRFYKQYVDYEVVYPQGFHKVLGIIPGREKQFLAEINRFYSRHLKRDQCCEHHPNGVMPWLPDAPRYERIYVELKPEQRKAYDQMNKDMLAWVGEHENEPVSAPAVIAKLARLQQFALAYVQPKYDENDEFIGYKMTEPSSKLDAVIELMEDNPEEPMVICSQWKQPLYLLGERLKAKGITYGFYSGDNAKTRDSVDKAEFIAGKRQHLLMVITAGGVGVDGLQDRCNTIVFLDRDWSPMINRQTEDRLDRGGQLKQVVVYDIESINTVDRGRHQHLVKQWDWIRRMLGDTKVAA
jgi:SNF2 family DNA or RNA helicase